MKPLVTVLRAVRFLKASLRRGAAAAGVVVFLEVCLRRIGLRSLTLSLFVSLTGVLGLVGVFVHKISLIDLDDVALVLVVVFGGVFVGVFIGVVGDLDKSSLIDLDDLALDLTGVFVFDDGSVSVGFDGVLSAAFFTLDDIKPTSLSSIWIKLSSVCSLNSTDVFKSSMLSSFVI